MATAEIATASGGSVNYADGEGMSFDSANQYLVKFMAGKIDEDIRPVAAPGEDNQGTQDFGLRSMEFSLEVIYVISSDAAYAQQVKSDLLTMAKVSTITVDTNTYAGCKLLSSEAEQAKQTGFGTVHGKVKLNFISYQPN